MQILPVLGLKNSIKWQFYNSHMPPFPTFSIMKGRFHTFSWFSRVRFVNIGCNTATIISVKFQWLGQFARELKLCTHSLVHCDTILLYLIKITALNMTLTAFYTFFFGPWSPRNSMSWYCLYYYQCFYFRRWLNPTDVWSNMQHLKPGSSRKFGQIMEDFIW